MFVPYTSECEYQLNFRCKDKPWCVATFYLDPMFKIHFKKRIRIRWVYISKNR